MELSSALLNTPRGLENERLQGCCDLHWLLNAHTCFHQHMCLHSEAPSHHCLQACEHSTTDLKSQLVRKQAAVDDGRRLHEQLEVRGAFQSFCGVSLISQLR